MKLKSDMYYNSEDNAIVTVTKYSAELAKFNNIKGDNNMETKQLEIIIDTKTNTHIRELVFVRDKLMDEYINGSPNGKKFLKLAEQLKEVADIELGNPRTSLRFTEEQETYLADILDEYEKQIDIVNQRAQEAKALLATCQSYEDCDHLMRSYGYIKPWKED